MDSYYYLFPSKHTSLSLPNQHRHATFEYHTVAVTGVSGSRSMTDPSHPKGYLCGLAIAAAVWEDVFNPEDDVLSPELRVADLHAHPLHLLPNPGPIV